MKDHDHIAALWAAHGFGFENRGRRLDVSMRQSPTNRELLISVLNPNIDKAQRETNYFYLMDALETDEEVAAVTRVLHMYGVHNEIEMD